MTSLADTDFLVGLIRRNQLALAKVDTFRIGSVAMSVINYCELLHGAAKCRFPQVELGKIEELRKSIPVLPLDPDVGETYGQIRADLEKRGEKIGPLDTLIAAHAIALGLTLITNNLREFKRVRGLKAESWA